MHKKRLLKLADLMDHVADNQRKKNMPKFNIVTFGSLPEHAATMKPAQKAAAAESCGTVACILGEAAIHGTFKRQGFGYIVSGWDGRSISVTLKTKGGVIGNFEAAAQLFDIPHAHAHALFSDSDLYGPDPLPTGARGARKAAKVIREYVARGGLPS